MKPTQQQQQLKPVVNPIARKQSHSLWAIDSIYLFSICICTQIHSPRSDLKSLQHNIEASVTNEVISWSPFFVLLFAPTTSADGPPNWSGGLHSAGIKRLLLFHSRLCVGSRRPSFPSFNNVGCFDTLCVYEKLTSHNYALSLPFPSLYLAIRPICFIQRWINYSSRNMPIEKRNGVVWLIVEWFD